MRREDGVVSKTTDTTPSARFFANSFLTAPSTPSAPSALLITRSRLRLRSSTTFHEPDGMGFCTDFFTVSFKFVTGPSAWMAIFGFGPGPIASWSCSPG